MAVFGYGRVSTAAQHTANQQQELEQSGYRIDYWHEDQGVSGAVPAMQRPGFVGMLDKMRHGETLVVSKLDRLGRDAIDVMQTVRALKERGISVKVHNLGGTDLTAPAGKLLLLMLSGVAELERDLIVERTQAGLQRAKADGKVLGRKPKTNEADRQIICARLAAGETVSAVARVFNVSRATVLNIKSQQSQGRVA